MSGRTRATDDVQQVVRQLRTAYEAPAKVARYAQRRAPRECRLLARMLSGLGPADVVLDAACGPGGDLPCVPKAHPVIALDLSLAMLRQLPARRWRCRMQADVLQLPLRDRAVDVTVCMRFLHHLSSPQAQAVAELARVTRRRGRSTVRYAVRAAVIVDTLRRAGFAAVTRRRPRPGWSETCLLRADRR